MKNDENTVELWDGTKLTRRSYSFTAEETAMIHAALRAALHDRIQHPFRDAREQREETQTLARLLSKIDGRLRPIGE